MFRRFIQVFDWIFWGAHLAVFLGVGLALVGSGNPVVFKIGIGLAGVGVSIVLAIYGALPYVWISHWVQDWFFAGKIKKGIFPDDDTVDANYKFRRKLDATKAARRVRVAKAKAEGRLD